MDYKKTPTNLSEYVFEREGCPIHYWLGGPKDRSLITMMHGATVDHRMFNAQVEDLIKTHRVLVWDARGHGKSQPIGNGFDIVTCAYDMLAILDSLGAKKFIILGQSMGGLIGQYLYRLAPDRTQAMIVIGSTPIAKAYSKFEVLALKATMPLFNVWPYKHFIKTVSNSIGLKAETKEYALEAIVQIDRSDFLTIWKAFTLIIDDQGIPGFIIDVPLLLLRGELDKAGTIARDMPEWAGWEPLVSYGIIPSASHNANQDNPVETNRLIREFLSTLNL